MKHLYGPLSSQVAESIGITEEFLRKKEVHADCIPCKCTSPEEAPEELEGAGPQKRANEVGMARGAPSGNCWGGPLGLTALLQGEEVPVGLFLPSLSWLGLLSLDCRGRAGLSAKDQERRVSC